MIDFRPQPPDDDQMPGHLKPPPNYFSRRVQLKIMAMVFVFMFVLIMIDQAGDPELYRWMWNRPSTAPPAPEASPGVPSSTANLAPATGQPDSLNWLPGRTSEDADYQHTQGDLWETLAASLAPREREILSGVLKASREERELPAELLTSWPSLLEKLAAGWNTYYEQAFVEVTKFETDLSDRQKKNWLDVLQRSKHFWDGPLFGGFSAIRQKKELSADQREALRDVQATLDQLALRQVRDHSLFRGSEHLIWFRLLEKLQRATNAEIAQASLADVDFLQLDNQGAEYRGRLVTVHGEIRQGYRVRAPKNILGIKEYSVFTVKPNTGPEQPVIVYCLGTPAGFPRLPDKDLDRRKASLREPASFTGYFFKSWLYRTETSSFSAPLILAKSPTWNNGQTVTANTSGELSSRQVALILVGTATLAILFSLFVYWRSRWENSAAAAHARDPATQGKLGEIPADQVGPNLHDALHKLAQEDSSKLDEPDRPGSGDSDDA